MHLGVNRPANTCSQFPPKCILHNFSPLPPIRAPPVLNFDFFKIQNKEDSYGYQKAETPYR